MKLLHYMQGLLAVIRFCREYRHYLLGWSFIVCTDHSSPTWLMRFKQPEGQLAQWLEELSQFDMTIQHRPGHKHGNADGLSMTIKITCLCHLPVNIIAKATSAICCGSSGWLLSKLAATMYIVYIVS